MKKDKSTPTIKDIASACGVSTATVSYVINGKSVLRPHTRERVVRAMREMNYHPSAIARGLQGSRMFTIGMLLGVVDPSEYLVNPYISGLLQGVIQQAKLEKFNVTLFTDDWLGEDSAISLTDGRTDGILVVAPRIGTDVMLTLPKHQRNLVAISAAPDRRIDTVDVDNFAGARMAVDHLIGLGHTRIGYLSGNADLVSCLPRMDGYAAALSAAGIAFDDEIVKQSAFDGSLACGQTQSLMALSHRPTAIFAGNDTIAFNVIDAATDLGLRVPDDLSVVGFDDFPGTSISNRNLTTVNQSVVEIGITATRLLIERIRHEMSGHPMEDFGRTEVVAPRLVIRGSTSAPAGSTSSPSLRQNLVIRGPQTQRTLS